MTADEDYGNAVIGYGNSLRVPIGKWTLQYTTIQDKKDHEVQLEFKSDGTFNYNRKSPNSADPLHKGNDKGSTNVELFDI